MVGVDQLVHRGLEVPGQGAADAARVQLGHGDAGVLHETAVDPDLAVFILQQDHLFVPEPPREELADERGFSCAQEAGDHIDFHHFHIPLSAGGIPAASPL